MNSQLYRQTLTGLLDGLAPEERDDAVAFYMEAIADRIDDGMSEEDAIAAAPTPEEAAAAILLNAKTNDASFTDAAAAASGASASTHPGHASAPGISGPGASPSSTADAGKSAGSKGFWQRLRKGKLSPLEWVGVVIASPVALVAAIVALALAIVAVCLALAGALVLAVLVLTVWILVLACWIVGITLAAVSPFCLVCAMWGLQAGDIPYFMVQLGYAFFGFGTGAWTLRGCMALTKRTWAAQQSLFAKLSHAWKRRLGRRTAKASAPNNPASAPTVAAPTPASAVSSAPDASATPATMASSQSAAAHWNTLFRVCLIMIAAGLLLVVCGFFASGLDWRVLSTSVYQNGTLFIGSTRIDDPLQLLLGPFRFWRS